jgi:hypothetical protein
MRRPLWLRVVITVWAVWLGAMLAGPPELHACPVHGDHASHQMSGADMADMAASAGHHGTPAHQPSSHCTCIGACCSAAPVAPPAGQVAEISVDEFTAVTPVAPMREDRAATPAPPYSLPFANGPPARA